MEGSGDESIEILDVENYRSDKMLVFNHQVLVMDVLRRLTEAGSHELRTGWFNETMDKFGNVTKKYVEDTRQRFISTVQTALNIMRCDFDTTAMKNIKEIEDEVKKQKVILIQEQWEWYESLPPIPKREFAGKIIKGFFNIELGWYLRFIELEVEAYRQIATELHSLTKRLDFYREEDFVA